MKDTSVHQPSASPQTPVILIGVLVIVMVMGMAAVNNARGSIPTATGTASATSTPPLPTTPPTWTATSTPSPTPSQTATPTDTATPTSTPTVTDTSTPTPTFTPWPTPDDGAHLREVKAPILMYHHVGPLPIDADRIRVGLTVAPDEFRRQLQYLRDRGYESVSLYDLQYALALGWPLPEKPIVFTFDDGYVDNYEYAFPLMSEFGYTGTIFVATQFIDERQPDYLTWEMAREMSAAGWHIEPHGKRHMQLAGRSRDFIIFEVLGSMETVAAHVGQRPRYFSYPAGKYDDDVIGILREIGFWGAVTVDQEFFHRLEDAHKWGRVRVNGRETVIDLALRMGEATPTRAPTSALPAETPAHGK